MSEHIDLEAYLERIGHAGRLRPDPETLQALHLAHATHIPFENFDILLGRPILLDTKSLEKKLVHGRRGGTASNKTYFSLPCSNSLAFQ